MRTFTQHLHPVNRPSQRGMTLIETIVAVFIFTVIFLTALMLFQAANRAYMQTDAATIQQQNIRFAMDRVTETLKDAGANNNPTGSKTLADEQIEAAWEAAVFVRGDFDNSREDGSNGLDLEDTAWPLVTTGNDEIVGFVLRKAGVGSTSLTFKADTTAPRNAVYTSDTSIAGEETKTVGVAVRDLSQQTSPPYQLTKVTFDDSGNPVYEVIAENVFRMWFDYLPETGTTEVVPSANNAAADSTERAARRNIRRIAINLISMTDRRDAGYTDTATYSPVEAAGTKTYRKLALSQRVASVNLGMKGKRHYNAPATEVVSPTYVRACNGHCRRYLISWPASVTAGAQYELSIYAAANSGAGLVEYNEVPLTLSTTQYEFAEPIADQTAGVYRSWVFKVRAIAGVEAGDWTQTVTRTGDDNDESIPADAQNVAAAQSSGENAMSVTWDPVAQNRAAITQNTCVDSDSNSTAPPNAWAISAPDLTNYKVYRVRVPLGGGVTGNDATTDVSTLEWGELKNATSTSASFVDYTAAPCSSYFYRVKGCDICNVTSQNYSAAMTQSARFAGLASGVKPSKPNKPTTTSMSYNSGSGAYTFGLQWDDVTRTSPGSNLAATAHYVLERWKKLATDPDYVHETSQDIDIYESTQSPTLTALDKISGVAVSYAYKVRGVYDCNVTEGGARPGDLSDPFILGCSPPSGYTVNITKPASGATVVRPTETTVPLEITVGGLNANWNSARFEIKQGGVVIDTIDIPSAPTANKYTASWNVSDVTSRPSVDYTVAASATTTDGCRGYATEIPFELDEVACDLSADLSTDDLLPAIGASTVHHKELVFKVTNNCGVTVNVSGMRLTWSGGMNSSAFINKIQYNGVDKTTTLTAASGASGALINFTTPVTLPTGTSQFFKAIYSAPKVGATWTSITVENSVTQQSDEVLSPSRSKHSHVIFDSTTDSLLPGTGNPKNYKFTFKVTNDTGATINIRRIKPTHNTTTAATSVTYNGTTYASGSFANGTFITLTSNIAIPAGTSANFEIIYGTTSMNNKQWSSIVTEDADTLEQHEIVMQTATP